MTLYSNRVALNCNPIINYYGPHYVGRIRNICVFDRGPYKVAKLKSGPHYVVRIRNICVFDRGPYKVANLKTGPQYDGKKLFLKKFK